MKAPVVVAIAVMSLLASIQSAEPGEELATVTSKALKQGTDARMNAWFASLLGIATNGAPLALKRFTATDKGITNVFNVCVEDKKTVILSVRERQMATFYLTDISGKLKRAVVNDGSIRDGGLTNISLAVAQNEFQRQKQFWVKFTPGDSGTDR